MYEDEKYATEPIRDDAHVKRIIEEITSKLLEDQFSPQERKEVLVMVRKNILIHYEERITHQKAILEEYDKAYSILKDN